MRPISKEEAMSRSKPRGKYYEVAEKYLRDFLRMVEEEKIDAAAIYFDEINPDLPPKPLYKSMHYQANKQNLPIKVVFDSEDERIILLYEEEET